MLCRPWLIAKPRANQSWLFPMIGEHLILKRTYNDKSFRRLEVNYGLSILRAVLGP